MKLKAFALFLLVFTGLHAQNKTALLIANSSYSNFSSLENPVPEANLLRDSLENHGFQVTLINNASKEDMIIGLRDFKRTLQKRGGIAFFHYGGHAVQVGGRNYLLPVDADIPDEDYVSLRAVDADEIMISLEQSGSKTNIVVLDSCRNNPLPAGSGRSASRGLAIAGRELPNTVVVYSAKSGQVALDGVFTPSLIKAINTPGLSLQEMLMQTRQDVYTQTGGTQIPGEYNQLFEPVYFSTAENSGTASSVSFGDVTLKPGSLTVSTVDQGVLLFAGREISIPENGQLPINDINPGIYTVSIRYADGHIESADVHIESDISENIAFSYNVPRKAVPGNFILVKAGTFTMGSPDNEDKRGNDETQHQVTLTRDFYIAETEVTQDLWFEIMGTSMKELSRKANATWDLVGDSPRHPAYFMTWYEAVEFCNRLSIRDGLTPCYSGSGRTLKCDFNANGYRLPTEAEWEYAARGGHLADASYIYAGSNDYNDVAWCRDNSRGTTHPVGQKLPNALGLYDMSGNVWEWCWDWYGRYKGDETDPVVRNSNSRHVLRGGDWYYNLNNARVANRESYVGRNRADRNGFRLVRTAN